MADDTFRKRLHRIKQLDEKIDNLRDRRERLLELTAAIYVKAARNTVLTVPDTNVVGSWRLVRHRGKQCRVERCGLTRDPKTGQYAWHITASILKCNGHRSQFQTTFTLPLSYRLNEDAAKDPRTHDGHLIGTVGWYGRPGRDGGATHWIIDGRTVCGIDLPSDAQQFGNPATAGNPPECRRCAKSMESALVGLCDRRKQALTTVP